MTSQTSALDPRRRRALYRATHRGTMEMDWFLGRFATARLAEMSDDRLDLFERLLAMPDPDLQQWITMGDRFGPSDFSGFVAEIRAFHGLRDED